MKNSNKKKSNNLPKKKILSQPIREAILLLLFSATSYVYLTLTTYNENDKSWINSSSADVENLGGLFGSHVSETLYFLFGKAAFLIPLLLIYIAVITYNRAKELDDESALIRYLGYVFFIISTCALLSIHSINNLEVGAGGITGDIIASLLVDKLNIVGSTIILITFSIVGMTFWLKFSWVNIFEIIGKYTILIISNVLNVLKKSHL